MIVLNKTSATSNWTWEYFFIWRNYGEL